MRVITLTIMDDGVYRGLRHYVGRMGADFVKAICAIVEPLGGMDDLELPPRHCCEYNRSNWQQGCRCNSSV